jgi:MoaA/NifB/PqqE/SkfB family radical SAM enzyme
MLNNMERLAEAGTANLGASFIVTRDNYKGICSAATAAKDVGATYFRVGAMYGPQMESYYEGIEGDIALRILMAQGDHGDFVFDQFTTRLNFMARKPKNPFCGYQLLNVYIGGDQKVYRCCEYAYNDHGYLGDLTNQSFRQWFESQETDEKYRCFDATKCVTCPFHTKNELIEFITRQDISETHPEFP